MEVEAIPVEFPAFPDAPSVTERMYKIPFFTAPSVHSCGVRRVSECVLLLRVLRGYDLVTTFFAFPIFILQGPSYKFSPVAGVRVGEDLLYLRNMCDVRLESGPRPSLPLIMRGYQFPARRVRHV